jgi:putative pbsx phage terminase small subunit
MDKQDLRDLLRKEYENGAGITELCRKYNQSINTVKSWKKRDGWKKKQINAPLTNAPPKKKSAPKMKKGAIEKEIKIQQDILNGKSKQEIMSEYGISERTYSRKTKNARELRKERTEKYLEKIVDEVYKGDIYKILKNTEVAKANLIIKTTNELSNKEKTNIKKIQEYEKAYQTIKKMGMDLMRTGKMLTPYEILEIEQQLVNEELLQEKLDLEKKKIEGEQIKDTKVEFKFKEKEIEELEDKKNE